MNLTGQKIKDTYQYLITNNSDNTISNGTGSIISSLGLNSLNVDNIYPKGSASFYFGTASVAVSASVAQVANSLGAGGVVGTLTNNINSPSITASFLKVIHTASIGDRVGIANSLPKFALDVSGTIGNSLGDLNISASGAIYFNNLPFIDSTGSFYYPFTGSTSHLPVLFANVLFTPGGGHQTNVLYYPNGSVLAADNGYIYYGGNATQILGDPDGNVYANIVKSQYQSSTTIQPDIDLTISVPGTEDVGGGNLTIVTAAQTTINATGWVAVIGEVLQLSSNDFINLEAATAVNIISDISDINLQCQNLNLSGSNGNARIVTTSHLHLVADLSTGSIVLESADVLGSDLNAFRISSNRNADNTNPYSWPLVLTTADGGRYNNGDEDDGFKAGDITIQAGKGGDGSNASGGGGNITLQSGANGDTSITSNIILQPSGGLVYVAGGLGIGIGDGFPTALLDVGGNVNIQGQLVVGQDNGKISINGDVNQPAVHLDATDGEISFINNGGGFLGVGTSNPVYRLDVSGTIGNSNGNLVISSSAGIKLNTNTQAVAQFQLPYSASAHVLNITPAYGTGSAYFYTSASVNKLFIFNGTTWVSSSMG